MNTPAGRIEELLAMGSLRTPQDTCELRQILAENPELAGLEAEYASVEAALTEYLATARPDDDFESVLLRNFRRRAVASGNPALWSWLYAFPWFRIMRWSGLIGAAAMLVVLGSQITSYMASAPDGRIAEHGDLMRAKDESFAMNSSEAGRPRESKDGENGGVSVSARPASGEEDTARDEMPRVPAVEPRPAATPGSTGDFRRGSEVTTARTKELEPLAAESEGARDVGGFEASPRSSEAGPSASSEGPAMQDAVPDSRKLITRGTVELEVEEFRDAERRVDEMTRKAGGYIASATSEILPNGRQRGTLTVRIPPTELGAFVAALTAVGEITRQNVEVEDATKTYSDTAARLRNARAMEDRLVDLLKTKTNRVADLLEVERELGRVRGEIEQMQSDLRQIDALAAFATLAIQIAEKDINEASAFLLKERVRIQLFTATVEASFSKMKTLAEEAGARVVRAAVREQTKGNAEATATLLVSPESANALIESLRAAADMGSYHRVSEQIARTGNEMDLSDGSRVIREKVQIDLTLSERDDPIQTTSLRIDTDEVEPVVERLKQAASDLGAEVKQSDLSIDANRQQHATLVLRLPLARSSDLIARASETGQVKSLVLNRSDRLPAAVAKADVRIQLFHAGALIKQEHGLLATLRRTFSQAFEAVLWSGRMAAVAIAFLAPWAIVLGTLFLLARWMWSKKKC